MLRLTGWFDTEPNALFFDLVFQEVGGFWRLEAIGAKFRPAMMTTKGGDTPNSKTGSAAGEETGAKTKSAKGSKAKPRL